MAPADVRADNTDRSGMTERGGQSSLPLESGDSIVRDIVRDLKHLQSESAPIRGARNFPYFRKTAGPQRPNELVVSYGLTLLQRESRASLSRLRSGRSVYGLGHVQIERDRLIC